MIKNVKSPKWANAENTLIDVICDIEIHGLFNVPHTVDASSELFKKIIAGEFGLIGDFVPYVPTLEELEAQKAMQVKAELIDVDLASVRAIREYIASKADAPQILKDRETLAAQLRVKLK